MSLIRRLVAASVVAMLIAACSGPTTPVANPSDSASAATATVSSAASATPSAETTPEPTETPEEVTPEPTVVPDGEAVVGMSQQFFKAWKDSIGSVEFQVVIEVKNTGGGYADLTAGDRSYTVYQKDGSVLETGSFTYAFPQVIGPGETGYFVDSGFFDDGTNVKTVGKMEPSVDYGPADEARDAYTVTKVKVSKESYGDGLQVSGVVKNTSSEDATSGMVGVILFDGSGKILGALYDNTGISDLHAGKSKGFKTSYPGTAPLKASQVKKTKAIAYDFSYF